MRRRAAALLAAALLSIMAPAALSFTAPVAAAPLPEDTGAGKTVIVVMDRIGLDDLTARDTPNYMRLMARGAFGLMNARIKYDVYGLGSYLVIGSGGRALGGQNVGLAFNSTEMLKTTSDEPVSAGEIFTTRTGKKAPPAGVVNLFIEEMRKKSDTNLATADPGILGQELRNAGRKVAVLGNADSRLPDSPSVLAPLPGETWRVPATGVQPVADSPGPFYPLQSFIHREVTAICMSRKGVISGGDVSKPLAVRGPDGNLVTDFAALEASARELLARSDVLTIDLGQTSRADEQYDFDSETQLKSRRRRAVRQCDAAIGRIAGMLDPARDTLVVCTPTPTRRMLRDGELVTPLLVVGKGFERGRQLSSSTTRRTGWVSNFDIAPTVLVSQGLGVPAGMDGTALASRGSRTDLDGLRQTRDRAVASYVSRRTLVRVYVITSICLIALFLLIMLTRKDLVDGHPLFWSVVLLSILAGPFAWLAIPAFGALPVGAAVAVGVGLAILLAFASLLIRRKQDGPGTLESTLLRPALALSSITLMLIALDTALGAPLMRFSSFGSDMVLGDRYYGIGNLCMGFSIGAAVTVACLGIYCYPAVFDTRWKRYVFAASVLGATIVFIGFPRLGANIGGLIACSAAAGAALVKLEGGRPTLKRAAVVIACLVVLLAAVLFIDSVLPGAATHAGRAVGKARGGGLGAVVGQAARKLTANWTLTFASTWRLLFLFGLVAWLVLNWKYALLKNVKKSASLYAGFFALSVGLATGWFFNDSGIEAVGAISVYLFVPFFLLLIKWRRPDRPPED